MDMMPPIWPWARRFIQTKNPMINSIGSMKGMSWPRKLTVGVENSTATSLSSIEASSSGGTSVGPVVVKSSPLVRVPLISWSTLFQTTLSTLPSSTCWTNSV